MVITINKTHLPVFAKLTIYPNLGHDAWTRTYDGSGMFQGEYNQYAMNIYEWMLQYKKSKFFE